MHMVRNLITCQYTCAFKHLPLSTSSNSKSIDLGFAEAILLSVINGIKCTFQVQGQNEVKRSTDRIPLIAQMAY